MDPRLEKLYMDSLAHTQRVREDNNRLKALATETDPERKAELAKEIRESLEERRRDGPVRSA